MTMQPNPPPEPVALQVLPTGAAQAQGTLPQAALPVAGLPAPPQWLTLQVASGNLLNLAALTD